MASKQADLTFWLGGAAVVGVVMGLGLAVLVRPGVGLAAGPAAAIAWFLVGAVRWWRRPEDS